MGEQTVVTIRNERFNPVEDFRIGDDWEIFYERLEQQFEAQEVAEGKKITELLREKYAVPLDSATTICNNYLRMFRNCPDNAPMDLDTWRHLLWSRALGDQYRNLAGDIYFKWLHLRYVYLALTSEIKFMLQRLRENYMLGLISNGPTAAQWEKINRLGLQDYFDVSLVSGDLPWEKPNPRIFYKACEYLGVEPKNCIMVGDKLETDIFGGIRAKLGGTVLLPLEPISNINELKPLPDYIIDSVTDLPSVLLPRNSSVPAFRHKLETKNYKNYVSVPDLEDCNSNSSDGS